MGKKITNSYYIKNGIRFLFKTMSLKFLNQHYSCIFLLRNMSSFYKIHSCLHILLSTFVHFHHTELVSWKSVAYILKEATHVN